MSDTVQVLLIDGKPIGYFPPTSAENVTYEEGVSVKDALDEVNVIKEVGNFKTNGTYTWSSSITNSKIFLVSLVLNNQIRQTVLMCSRQELFKTNGVFPDFMTSDGRVYCQITANDSGYTVSQLSGLSNVGASAALSIQAT